MKKYSHIIFDLDHTLWDFVTNSNETLKELYDSYNLISLGFDLKDFLKYYHEVNDQMWDDYNKGKINKDDMRFKRFRETLSKVGVQDNVLAENLNNDYLKVCPSKGYLVPYALEVLHYLKDNYHLHILTNGFRDSQQVKISTSGIESFFKEVVNSESSGFLKPDLRMFQHLLEKIAADCSECIMIGDDLYADVLGAKNAGIDHVFFNRKSLIHKEEIMHEIKCLSELKSIL